MPNYTIDDYKKAIKKKYEVEKRGEFSNHFNPASNVNLKNLCVKRYNSNNSEDDLEIFFAFFGFGFDTTRRNLFNDYLDKFKNVRSFLTGKTISPKDETIHFSAVLVDFHPRPLNKFLSQWKGDEENVPNDSDPIIVREEENTENQETKIDTINNDKEPFIKEEKIETKIEELENHPINSSVDVNTEVLAKKPPIKMKHIIIGASIFLFVGFVVIFFSFQNKQCMQWSGDHYDIVDCNLKIDGIIKSYKIELLDPTLVNLKKITVCDTTTCFDKNGTAIIWYAKTANGVDFFDAHGRHPENNSPLRPVTQYILNKYLKR